MISFMWQALCWAPQIRQEPLTFLGGQAGGGCRLVSQGHTAAFWSVGDPQGKAYRVGQQSEKAGPLTGWSRS